MEKIVVIGAGYVGLVTAVCLADIGQTVTCYEIDEQKVRRLKRGQIPFYEPDLIKLLQTNIKRKRLKFVGNMVAGLDAASLIFICVGTPPRGDGSADMRAYYQVIDEIGHYLRDLTPLAKKVIIVNKSTVPVGTGRQAQLILDRLAGPDRAAVISNPEFLREGKAVNDFMKPTRIVFGYGSPDKDVRARTQAVFAKFVAPKINTSWESAEMIKYAANCFLTTKICFINEISNLCEKSGANVGVVAQGIGLDPRIGPQFLQAGIGYGGGCFPKDVLALRYLAKSKKVPSRLLAANLQVNQGQRDLAVKKISQVLEGNVRDKQVAVLGLAFKPETDDTRDSPAIAIIEQLLTSGAHVKAYDPVAGANAGRELGKYKNFRLIHNLHQTPARADVLFLATDWPVFKTLNWPAVKRQMRGATVIDGRNFLDQALIERAGLKYIGFGLAPDSLI